MEHAIYLVLILTSVVSLTFIIERALARTSGHKGQAAALLGLKRTTLVEKLKRL